MLHLDEGDPAGAGAALQVADGDLAVVFQVPLLTQDVMDAGHHFVPLIVISKPAEEKKNFRSKSVFPIHYQIVLINFICFGYFFFLPFQNDINHSCWQNLKRFTPEFIFPPLVCSV